jgi:hypothetical protein
VVLTAWPTLVPEGGPRQLDCLTMLRLELRPASWLFWPSRKRMHNLHGRHMGRRTATGNGILAAQMRMTNPRQFPRVQQRGALQRQQRLLAVFVVLGCGGRLENQKTEVAAGGNGASTAAGGNATGSSGANNAAAGSGARAATEGNAEAAGRSECERPAQWADLPDCAYIDGCRLPGGDYVSCAIGGDCSVRFVEAVPDMPLYSLSLCEQNYDSRPYSTDGDWTLSADRSSIVLGESLCERLQRARQPQLIMMSIHSCIW